jgi:hypothetical protein
VHVACRQARLGCAFDRFLRAREKPAGGRERERKRDRGDTGEIVSTKADRRTETKKQDGCVDAARLAYYLLACIGGNNGAVTPHSDEGERSAFHSHTEHTISGCSLLTGPVSFCFFSLLLAVLEVGFFVQFLVGINEKHWLLEFMYLALHHMILFPMEMFDAEDGSYFEKVME